MIKHFDISTYLDKHNTSDDIPEKAADLVVSGLSARPDWPRTLRMEWGVEAEWGADNCPLLGVFRLTGGVCSSDRAAALVIRLNLL